MRWGRIIWSAASVAVAGAAAQLVFRPSRVRRLKLELAIANAMLRGTMDSCVDLACELGRRDAQLRTLELELEQSKRYLEAAERERDEAWGLIKAMDS